MSAQMQQLVDSLTTMNAQLNSQAADQALLKAQNESLNRRLQEKETAAAAAMSTELPRGAPGTAGVQTWAPDHLSGKHADWPDWSLKFRSYMGAMLQGQLGRWLEYVDSDRETSAVVAALGEESRTSASLLHSALVATCQNAALTVVKRAGAGEGLEAWRNLLRKYEPRTKQTKVVKLLLSVLSFSFKGHDIIDALERFEEECGEYEKEAGKSLDDEIKIGVTIRGIDDGPLREHLLLHSERCTNYADFRSEVETIARARANATWASPMDISAFGGGGKGGGKFSGTCNNCGKTGHKAKDCFGPGGGAAKAGGKRGGKGGGGKGSYNSGGKSSYNSGGKSWNPGGSSDRKCYQCGMGNHLAKDCKASDEKKKKWKASQGSKNFRELEEDTEPWPGAGRDHSNGGDMGQFDLCQLSGQDFMVVSDNVRVDDADREIIFAVDSAACRTVVSKNHRAVRGYKVWRDKFFGQTYGTAKAGGPRIADEGLRVLQTKASGMDPPMRLHTRKADVRKPLMAVCDMVDHNHAVLFDSGGSYAIHKKTGRKTTFTRNGRGWDLKLVLEAPEKANEVMAGVLAELREELAKTNHVVELNISDEKPEVLGFTWAARLGGCA